MQGHLQDNLRSISHLKKTKSLVLYVFILSLFCCFPEEIKQACSKLSTATERIEDCVEEPVLEIDCKGSNSGNIQSTVLENENTEFTGVLEITSRTDPSGSLSRQNSTELFSTTAEDANCSQTLCDEEEGCGILDDPSICMHDVGVQVQVHSVCNSLYSRGDNARQNRRSTKWS